MILHTMFRVASVLRRPVLCAVFCLALCSGVSASPAASLEEMAGQMILVGFRGLELDEDSPIVRDVAAGRVGGVVLFDYDVLLKKPERNVQSPEQVRRLTAFLAVHARTPILVAVDQEGGRVQRLKARNGFRDFPSAADMGGWNDPGRVRAAGADLGRVLAGAGFNLDFAPCVDLNVNPQSPAIGALGRSFSADPDRVVADARAFAQGLASAGVLSCLKHFPGHGSAASDSHLGFTDVTATWSAAELAPYRALIGQGAADMVMTAHVFNAALDPEYPASLSARITGGLLRRDLGFNGVVVTDDLQMRAVTDKYSLDQTVRLALAAGADILLFGNNLAHDPDLPAKVQGILVGLVRDGAVPRARIEESYGRIMALKKKLNLQQ